MKSNTNKNPNLIDLRIRHGMFSLLGLHADSRRSLMVNDDVQDFTCWIFH